MYVCLDHPKGEQSLHESHNCLLSLTFSVCSFSCKQSFFCTSTVYPCQEIESTDK